MTIIEAKEKLFKSIDKKEYRKAVYWCDFIVKSRCLGKWDGFLTDKDIEEAIKIIGKNINSLHTEEKYDGPRGILHVVTDIWHWGGATQYLERWLTTRNEQSVIYVTKPGNYEGIKILKTKINNNCSIIESIDADIVDNSIKLRNIARYSDYVVVHSSAHDIVPCLAFADKDLPVVIRNNIDDHLYWPGVTIYDGIINFRSIGDDWTRKYRGSQRSFVLPLPLDEQLFRDIGREEKLSLRQKYGISKNDVVLISSGSTYKFNSYRNYIYMDIVNEIIGKTENTIFIIIGHPKCQINNKRIVIKDIIDNRDEYLNLLKIADIAVTSLPFSSQTAILEMGLMGMPCVLPPKDIPMGIEDISFNKIKIPENREELIKMAIMYVKDERKRVKDGAYVKQKIKEYHNCNSWSKKLEQILTSNAYGHNIYNIDQYEKFDENTVNYWNEIRQKDISTRKNNYHYIFICNNYPISPFEMKDFIQKKCIKVIEEIIIYILRKIRYNIGKIRKKEKFKNV